MLFPAFAQILKMIFGNFERLANSAMSEYLHMVSSGMPTEISRHLKFLNKSLTNYIFVVIRSVSVFAALCFGLRSACQLCCGVWEEMKPFRSFPSSEIRSNVSERWMRVSPVGTR